MSTSYAFVATLEPMRFLLQPDAMDTAAVPDTPAALIRGVVKPFKLRLSLFFILSFIGVLAYTSGPLIVSRIVTEIGNSRSIDHWVYVLAVLYVVFRVLDESLWIVAELIMRSIKPQMVETVR